MKSVLILIAGLFIIGCAHKQEWNCVPKSYVRDGVTYQGSWCIPR